MTRVRIAVLLLLAVGLAACGGEEPPRPAAAPSPDPPAGPRSGGQQSAAVRAAEADLLRSLRAVAAPVGGSPDFERSPATPCPEPPGRVTAGAAQRLAVTDPHTALEAAAQAFEAAGWAVRKTPTAVFATRDGASASLVMQADGRTARLSGGTPCLPGIAER